ncbi:MAG: hypothetical protein ACO1TE_06175 [Prosthecobacter sp.]
MSELHAIGIRALRLIVVMTGFLAAPVAGAAHGQELARAPAPALAQVVETPAPRQHQPAEESDWRMMSRSERRAARWRRDRGKFVGIFLASLALSFGMASIVYKGIRHRARPMVWLAGGMSAVVAICSVAGPFGWGQVELAGWMVGLFVAVPVTFCVLLMWISNGGTLRR